MSMNITPEQIPDEVVEAAVAAWNEHPDYGTVQSMYTAMAAALAAALPALLGEPILWRVRCANGQVMHFDYEPKHMRTYWPLYTLPTPETPNAHP